MLSKDILQSLMTVIEERKCASGDDSYVASLFEKGREHILKKVGEECIETVLAAQSGDTQHVIYETADLWFHTLIMLSEQNVSVDEVFTELARRFGLSGHDEKRARSEK